MRRMTLLILSMMLVPPAVAAQEALRAAVEDGVTSRSRRHLRIDLTAEVFEELELLADTLRVETVRCLIGLAQGDSLLVDLAWQPPIHHSTPTGVGYRPCPVATIALWHNHPWTGEFEPEYSCYLSQTDIRAAIQSWAPPIQMVQVSGACRVLTAHELIAGPQELSPPLSPEHQKEQEADGERRGDETSDRDTDQAADSSHDAHMEVSGRATR